jgi:23S rRNA (pseudouridine1915-N3)-methyltransferase
MQLHLIAVGTRVPDWVGLGYEEYARRMPPECRLNLKAVALRGKLPPGNERKRREAELLLEALPTRATVVALDEHGANWSTRKLADRLGDWMEQGRDVAFMVGGPDGLDERCKEKADLTWSLSALTLPHAMVRVVVAEQLYRASALLKGHPYHRE